MMALGKTREDMAAEVAEALRRSDEAYDTAMEALYDLLNRVTRLVEGVGRSPSEAVWDQTIRGLEDLEVDYLNNAVHLADMAKRWLDNVRVARTLYALSTREEASK